MDRLDLASLPIWQPYTPPPPACATCDDVLFVPTPTNPDLFMRCPACNSLEAHLIDRCLTVAGMKLDSPEPKTLEDFVTHDDYTERMLAAAVTFANSPVGWLTFYGRGQGRQDRNEGRWGSGKSHLCEAITRALLGARMPALFITLDRLMVYLGAGWREDGDDIDYERRLAWVKSLPVLVLDEVNKESPSPSAERLRLGVLQDRYRRIAPTVLASNDHPNHWMDPAIADRAMDTRFVAVEVTPVSFRRVKR